MRTFVRISESAILYTPTEESQAKGESSFVNFLRIYFMYFIIRHLDSKLLLICILLLSHSLIFFKFLFYKNMVVIYVFLLEEAMYSYCCLCIVIVVYVLSMYS